MVLFEIILVIAIMLGVYSAVVPRLDFYGETKVALTLSRLRGDIRAARDEALLSGQVHRLVFLFKENRYKLERRESEGMYFVPQGLDQEDKQIFWEKYIPSSPLEVRRGDEILKMETPLTVLQSLAKPEVWKEVQSMDWQGRSVDGLMLYEMRAEHHPQKLEPSDEKGMLYVFPDGTVEKAVLALGYTKGELEDGQRILDPDKEPYTLVTEPFQGTAQLITGKLEKSWDDLWLRGLDES